jgi:nucleoside-diphosphate-sugar epimerase
VLEVVTLIAKLGGGLEPDVQGAGNPAGEIDRQWVDPTKFKEMCGWVPSVGLEEGIQKTIDWYREHPESLAP